MDQKLEQQNKLQQNHQQNHQLPNQVSNSPSSSDKSSIQKPELPYIQNPKRQNTQQKEPEKNVQTKQQVKQKRYPYRVRQDGQPVRYKYCCRKCKHTQKGKKACVCVVPRSQRRMQLGENGCKTCLCHGCSIEDFIARGEDPEYKPKKEEQQSVASFEARNGCCKRCIKAFSKNNKSCLCQVPKNVCKVRLPPQGCKFCGCHGCNPQDLRKEAPRHSSRSRSRERRKHQEQDASQQGFNNLDLSPIGLSIKEANILGPLIGFGVPQRTKSYIFGRH